MKSSNTEAIVKSIAREYGYSEREIFDMIKAPFDLLAKVMREADRESLDFPSVRIKYFATFYCSEDRKKYFKKLKEYRDNAAARREIYGTRAEITPVFPRTD